MAKQSRLADMLQKMTDRSSVKSVFGDPVSVGRRTVIPVARVWLGFGGGESGEETGEGSGLGGGAGLMATPLGVYEVTEDGTDFIPMRPWRRTLMGMLAGMALAMVLMGVMRRRMRMLRARRHDFSI